MENNKKSPVAWQTMCSPRKQEGQRIINLTIWNKVTLIKCMWNLYKKTDNMWVKWIHNYYFKGQSVMAISIGNNGSWIIKNILNLREEVMQCQQVWEKMPS